MHLREPSAEPRGVWGTECTLFTCGSPRSFTSTRNKTSPSGLSLPFCKGYGFSSGTKMKAQEACTPQQPSLHSVLWRTPVVLPSGAQGLGYRHKPHFLVGTLETPGFPAS